MPRSRSHQSKSPHTLTGDGEARTPKGLFALALLYFCAGCGSPSGPPAVSEPEAPSAEPSPETEANESSPAELPDEDDGEEGDESAGSDGESASAAEDPDAVREVVYQKGTGALTITVDGVRFKVTATPKRVGGGWGVVVAAEAEVIGEETRYLLSPTGGPLAFHTTVVKLSDKTKPIQKLGDKRVGDEEQLVVPDDSLSFNREWPRAKEGEKPLYRNQQLTLEVALWGVGSTSRKTRAVKRFARVTMVSAGGRKPQAFVSPPD